MVGSLRRTFLVRPHPLGHTGDAGHPHLESEGKGFRRHPHLMGFPVPGRLGRNPPPPVGQG